MCICIYIFCCGGSDVNNVSAKLREWSEEEGTELKEGEMVGPEKGSE